MSLTAKSAVSSFVKMHSSPNFCVKIHLFKLNSFLILHNPHKTRSVANVVQNVLLLLHLFLTADPGNIIFEILDPYPRKSRRSLWPNVPLTLVLRLDYLILSVFIEWIRQGKKSSLWVQTVTWFTQTEWHAPWRRRSWSRHHQWCTQRRCCPAETGPLGLFSAVHTTFLHTAIKRKEKDK